MGFLFTFLCVNTYKHKIDGQNHIVIFKRNNCVRKTDMIKMPCKNLVRGHFTQFIVFDKFEKDVRK